MSLTKASHTQAIPTPISVTEKEQYCMFKYLMGPSKLRENKIFVIVYRSCAFFLGIWGILTTAGVFRKAFNPVILLAYTIQSNILVIVFFGILLARTIVCIYDKEKRAAPSGSPYSFFPRLSAFVTLAIFVTMLVYWFILLPISVQTMSLSGIFAFDNLVVHLFMPLLMLVDYLALTERGKFKKYDFLLCAVIPYVYLAEAMTLGLTRAVRYDSLGVHSYYLYVFLDVDQFGALVIPMVAAITLFFMAIMLLWQRLDKRLAAKIKSSR
jgi:hypothetical protein